MNLCDGSWYIVFVLNNTGIEGDVAMGDDAAMLTKNGVQEPATRSGSGISIPSVKTASAHQVGFDAVLQKDREVV